MNFKQQLIKLSLIGCLTSSLFICAEKPVQAQVHVVTDLSHEFSFYSDNRFHGQYVKGGQFATNWANLYDFDFSNANLLVLLGCDNRIAYTPKDIKVIKKFISSGGGVVILGSEGATSQNKLIKEFGVTVDGGVEFPLTYTDNSNIIGQGRTSAFTFDNKKWEVLVKDKNNKAVLAKKKIGKGQVLIGSRSIAGSNPNASDSINYQMWRPLLKEIASGKKVDSNKPFKSLGIGDLKHKDKHETFILSYNDYMKPYADAMVDITNRCMPVIENRMGVPLSKGMGSEITLLATGGGGFSSGTVIALAVWWGDFPKKEDSMIEFITHESVHSWVLPYPEVWNEPIATYVGNLVMMDMGHKEEAMRRIQSTITRALPYDPKMDRYDVQGISVNGYPNLTGAIKNDVHWGKTYWVFEELRKEYPDIVKKYFQSKRELIGSKKLKAYDMNNTVAVFSHALGKDMFPWFKKHGFNVDKNKAEL